MISGYQKKINGKYDFHSGDLFIIYDNLVTKLYDSIRAIRAFEGEDYLFETTDHYLKISGIELKFSDLSILFSQKYEVEIQLFLTHVKISYGITQFVIVSHLEFLDILDEFHKTSEPLSKFIVYLSKDLKEYLAKNYFKFLQF